jgi:hypothetical protein
VCVPLRIHRPSLSTSKVKNDESLQEIKTYEGAEVQLHLLFTSALNTSELFHVTSTLPPVKSCKSPLRVGALKVRSGCFAYDVSLKQTRRFSGP